MIRLAAAFLCLLAAIVLRPLTSFDPVIHVLIQLPLLAAAGWIVAGLWAKRVSRLTPSHTATLLIVALWTLASWMLPRNIDLALSDPGMDLAKFLSIPVLFGVPLALAWARLGTLLRGLLKAQAISMLGVLAFVYTHAPVRICNAYLVSDQERLGLGFLVVALTLAVLWSLPVFLGRPLAFKTTRKEGQSAGVTA